MTLTKIVESGGAETVAVEAFSFLSGRRAAQPLPRLSGLRRNHPPGRRLAGFPRAVLDHVASDEPLLVALPTDSSTKPENHGRPGGPSRRGVRVLRRPRAAPLLPGLPDAGCAAWRTGACVRLASPARAPGARSLGIAHIDCDAFFAAIEKRDDPSLADKPVIIGGGNRGVVSTACYIARTYGVRSAMPMFKALEACPHAVVIRPKSRNTACVGREVRQLMLELTPLVEPVSIDEAFLDLDGRSACTTPALP